MQPFYVVNDVELESGRDGSAAIYWAAASTWTMLRGAGSFQIAARPLQIDTATVDVFLQYSEDGVSWQPYAGGSLFSDAPITSSNTSESRRVNLPDEVLFAPFHRFGVQIEGASSQVRARMVVSVVPVSARDRVINAAFGTTDINGVSVGSLFGNEVEADFAKSACIVISSELSGAESANIQVHGSVDGSTYVPIAGATLALDAGSGITGGTINLGDGALPPWIQLYLDDKQSVNSEANVTGTAVLRNF